MTPIDRISAADAAPAGGHYSQAVGWGDLVFISGQLPVGVDGTHDPAAAFAGQAERAIANLLAVLRASGGTPADLLKVTVYLADVMHWAEFSGLCAPDRRGEAGAQHRSGARSTSRLSGGNRCHCATRDALNRRSGNVLSG